MTPDDYTTLTQREKDALVATEVMGWHKDGNLWGIWLDEEHSKKNLLLASHQWTPTKNTNDAFKVVDAMIAAGWLFTLKYTAYRYWNAEFWKEELQPIFYGDAINKAKAEAICLAALKAKGTIE